MGVRRRLRSNWGMQKILSRIWQWALTGNIKTVTAIPVVFGFLFLIGSLILGQRLFGAEYPEAYLFSINFIALISMGLSGIIQIVRKEDPGIFGGTAKGILPITMGWLLLIFTWGSALFLAIYFIKTSF